MDESVKVTPAAPTDALLSQWEVFRQRLHKRLLGEMTTNVASMQATEARRAIEWAVKENLPPGAVTREILDELQNRFIATLDKGPNEKRPTIQFYRQRSIGRRILEEPLLEEPPEPVMKKPVGRPKLNPPAPPAEDTTMARSNPDDELPELNPDGDEGDGGDEGGDDGDEGEPLDVRPSRRPKRQAVQTPVVMMQMPAPRRGATTRAAPPRSKLFNTPEKVRIYKRGMGGKRILINEYTTDDIGDMSLHVFIKEWIDPEFGDASGLTTYEAVGVNPHTGKDTTSASTVTIESQPQPEMANSPVGQVRDALGLIQEMQEMQGSKNTKQQELLAAAQAKAAGSGDMSQLMVLMLLDKFQNKNDQPDLMKVVELIQKRNDVNIPTLNSVPMGPPQPYVMPPMAPPQESPLEKLMATVLPLLLKPQPDFFEQMMKFQQMQNMMGGGGNANAAALAAIAHKLDAPRPAGGIEESLTMFEKLSTAVKTLAPQLNMGGLTGAIQTILTPELGKALGGVIAQGIEKQTAGPQSGAKTLPAAGAPAAPARPAIDPAIMSKVQVLRIAQTPPVQIAATIDLLSTMWSGQFKAQLEPALGQLLAGNVDPARAALHAILTDARPELAHGGFIDDVLRSMATQNNLPIPAALVQPAEAPAAPVVAGQPPVDPNTPAANAKVEVTTFVKPPEPPPEPYVEHQPMIPKPKLVTTPASPQDGDLGEPPIASPVPALA